MQDNNSLDTTHKDTAMELQDSLNKVNERRKELQHQIPILEGELITLENEFFKKQSGVFNRWFTKKETIESLGIEVDEKRNQLNSLKNELAKCTVNIDEFSEPKYEDKYQEVASAFQGVCGSAKI